MKKFFKHQRINIFIVLGIIFFLLIFFETFSHVRNILTDTLHGRSKALDNVVIVAIDDTSIQKIGRWPWNRDVFAQVLENLKEARTIGIDVSFFEVSEHDDKLRKTLESTYNVVLAAEVNKGTLYKPIFNKAFGYANLPLDKDGVVRSVDTRLYNDIQPFAFEIYEKAWNIKPMQNQDKYFINFAALNTFKTLSFSEVLENDIDVRDKIVLIGATAPDLHDVHLVPTSSGKAIPGVEVHANIIQNIILDNFLQQQGKLSIIILVMIIGALGLFVLSRMNIFYSIIIVFVFLILYSFLSIFIFNKFNYVIDLFFIPLSLVIFTGVGQAVNYLEEKKERKYLTEAFGKYISKDVLKEIVDHKKELKLGGEKREITIFFSDIRGFTTLSEHLTPEKLVHFLNEYLTQMTGIILKKKGTLDKFIGDAIMAFWNAPILEDNHAALACEAALEQVKTLNELRKKWKEQGFPDIMIGCGIHTGEAIIGNMGGEDRFDYTAIGDSVNLASRLEGLTKQYGVSIILSEQSYKKVKEQFAFRKLDAVKVKGKKIPVVLYELCIDSDDKFVKTYENGFSFYFERKFKEALREFEKALAIHKEDKASGLFIERCKLYIKSPPPKDWDGAFEMKTK